MNINLRVVYKKQETQHKSHQGNEYALTKVHLRNLRVNEERKKETSSKVRLAEEWA